MMFRNRSKSLAKTTSRSTYLSLIIALHSHRGQRSWDIDTYCHRSIILIFSVFSTRTMKESGGRVHHIMVGGGLAARGGQRSHCLQNRGPIRGLILGITFEDWGNAERRRRRPQNDTRRRQCKGGSLSEREATSRQTTGPRRTPNHFRNRTSTWLTSGQRT